MIYSLFKEVFREFFDNKRLLLIFVRSFLRSLFKLVINKKKGHFLKDQRKIKRSMIHGFDLVIVEELVRNFEDLLLHAILLIKHCERIPSFDNS